MYVREADDGPCARVVPIGLYDLHVLVLLTTTRQRQLDRRAVCTHTRALAVEHASNELARGMCIGEAEVA